MNPESETPPDLPEVLAQACAKYGLNDDEIKAVQGEVLDAVEASLKADESTRSQERDAIFAELKAAWGEDAEAALEAASFAAESFGMDEDDVDDLLDAGKADQIIAALARMGRALRDLDEADAAAEVSGQGAAVTAQAAQDELQRLAADSDHRTAFLNRAHPGHAAAKAKRAQLISATQGGGRVHG